MTSASMQSLSRAQASTIASLVAMGAQSGATVMGLSGVRRSRDLELVFVDVSISANSQQELARLSVHGVRVFLVDGLDSITTRMGRDDVHVLGVKEGDLAAGIVAKLPPPESVEETDLLT